MIIVTGGAGFIGSALIAELNKRKITDILVVDELGCDEKWKNLRNLSFADYIEKDDFLKMVVEDKLTGHSQAVFHLGACSSTTETNASYLIKNNYEYTKLLAQWATSNNIRFIYASSAATYGDGSNGFSDDEEKIDKLRPLNMYGYSKHLFDLWARRTGLLKKTVGLKYFNVFGPNEYHKGDMRSFVLKAFEQIKAAGKVRLFKSYKPDYADGEQLRDFIYVKDAVDMTLFFLDNLKTTGLFNIGSGEARNWNDLVKAVFAAMGSPREINLNRQNHKALVENNISRGKKPNPVPSEACPEQSRRVEGIEYIDMPESIRNQYQYFTQAEMTKLHKTGYKKHTTSLEDTIKDYVQNYLIKGRYLTSD
jgi:ADP-L-glycero-D-manno-heptose 6-epimerase